MNLYFSPEQSIHYKQGAQHASILETIAHKYIASNPANGFTFRTVSTKSFRQMEDGRYDLQFNAKFPNSRNGNYGYACALVYSEQEFVAGLSLSCYGPTKIYLNSSLFYQSTMEDDVNVNRRKSLQVTLRKGWNIFFLKMIKTSSGFGCRFGSDNNKWFPLQFLSPFSERAGSGGWAYAGPTFADAYPIEWIPGHNSLEADMPTKWLPDLSTLQKTHSTCDMGRIFNPYSGAVGYGWSSFMVRDMGSNNECRLSGRSSGPVRIWINDILVLEDDGLGALQATFSIGHGKNHLMVESICVGHNWEYTLEVSVNGNPCSLACPADVKGITGSWLYLGPFGEPIERLDQIQTLHRLFHYPSGSPVGSIASGVYWTTQDCNIHVRPYLENELFAKWNYPLGVTLYGLLQAGQMLEKPYIVDYAIGHIQACTRLYEYSLWDKERYGSPAINHQLVELNMLDDCGSFGSAMLEACSIQQDESFLSIAPIIADYILNKQERKADGAFYRRREGEYQENTLWADDLYMSIPFLCRYYQLSGDAVYIDEAARQFLLFHDYLYMPELQVMSHVYDFKYNTPTHIAWGRGNGWVLFSLSELLAVLPEEHLKRGELIELFRSLAGGYLKLQGEKGLWHQVLNDSCSYEETSCTAMFTYAFCRGIRYSWLNEAEHYVGAVDRAWEALTKYSIDQSGNVYGVCRGSGYSFTPSYYKDELNWILNDTHGIGIVLLCGIEYLKLQSHLKQ
jgi:unsaturated rhamnogalacturonyl hydrolase